MNRILKIFLFLFFLTGISFEGLSTHNRAGEITYKRIAPFEAIVGGVKVPVFTYSITIIKYTAGSVDPQPGEQIADRCVDTVDFGDGQSGIALRINGFPGACCASVAGRTVGCGEMLINETNYKVKRNVYTIIHTYPGAGTYVIKSLDPNRNGNVHNIPGSINLPFYIESMLVINNLTGANSSPIFSFPPVDKACMNICFEHNPGAYDPDGDSLSYELTTSRGANGQTVLGYFYPEYPNGGSFGIDARTGLLRWCHPLLTEEYNIAFIVREWRRSPGGGYQMIGYVLRDMQVIVEPCPNLHPPLIDPISDVCVEAGTIVNKQIVVRDKTNGDRITLTGGGGAFETNSPVASLTPTAGNTFTSSGSSFTSNFTWQTNCDHIRLQPYSTTFKAEDAGLTVKLVSFQSFNIRVIPAAVKNVTAIPAGTTMRISWSPVVCKPGNNSLKGYKVYRKNDCEVFTADPCRSGITPGSGFVEVGTAKPTETLLIDDNNKNGLIVGQNYSYVVVALYEDGSQAYASTQVCSKLKRDVPVLINADVLSTSSSGSVHVKWIKPLTGPENLDLSVFKGPYRFELRHRKNSSEPFVTVFTTSDPVLNNLAEDFYHTGIPTDSATHEYLIDFYSDTVKVGSSQRATTIFLTTAPSDRRIDLKWSSYTPWDNYSYTVYRQAPGSSSFVSIGTTSTTTFTDRNGVENGKTYCYFVRSEGAYSDSTIIKPLINNSQESCATAIDLTPPGTPTVSIDANCPNGIVQVSWSDIIDISDDVGKYILYYKPSLNDEYREVVTVKQGNSLLYSSDGLPSISGCYAVRAVDINNNAGDLSEDFCIDNCPEFELPNIFTPNGDSINDYYKAIKVRQIKEIYLTITDRWGNLVYTTRDPYFKWNGESVVTKLPVSEGTFFYVCDVFEPRLKGIHKRNIKGYLQVVR